MSRIPFALRLAISLLVTMLAIGGLQYLLAARALSKRVVEQTTSAHRADARVVSRLFDGDAREPWKPVRELLGHVAARPGVVDVGIVDARGRFAAVGVAHDARTGGSGIGGSMDGDEMSSRPEGHGAEPHGFAEGRILPAAARPVVDRVLASGRSFGGRAPGAGTADGLHAVPVDLGGRRHALVVVKESDLVGAQLADMRVILLVTVGAGLLLSFPLFYSLGGRELAARHRRALRNSSVDSLTGVGNHRAFHEELRRQVEVARRRERSVSLVLLDLDGFKQVNDSRGHRAGDEVLARVGAILADGRTGDRPYRIGGDEFAVVLPETPLDPASVAAARICDRIADEVDGVTASVGVSSLGAPARDADTLIACSDMALYEAKGGGGNRVCGTGAPSPSSGSEAAAVAHG